MGMKHLRWFTIENYHVKKIWLKWILFIKLPNHPRSKCEHGDTVLQRCAFWGCNYDFLSCGHKQPEEPFSGLTALTFASVISRDSVPHLRQTGFTSNQISVVVTLSVYLCLYSCHAMHICMYSPFTRFHWFCLYSCWVQMLLNGSISHICFGNGVCIGTRW